MGAKPYQQVLLFNNLKPLIPERKYMKQICRIIIAICLPLLLWGEAHAQHSGPYVGGFFGGDLLMPAKSSDSTGDFNLKFKPDMLWSAVVGWDLEPGDPIGEGRIELEYSRRINTLDKVTFAEGSFAGGGTVKAESLLVNFFGVYHDDTGFSPYVGIGVGAARIEASNLQESGFPLGSGRKDVFAYQGGFGVDCQLTSYLNLDLGYRYFATLRPTFTEVGGSKMKMDYQSHNVLLGVRLGF
jgi:opacity protein-like surface antigen